MHMMLKFTIPVVKGNQAIKDGTMVKALDQMIDTLQPESVYFFVEDGKRAGIMIFETSDAGLFAKANEPLFAALDAAIDITPVVEREVLKKSLVSMAK
ncbi:MAG: hypothetical protein GY710_11205 [Desulfobacteraceae bacterium]|nr:hypothetical protein [Desulfobacteraceae bacterium]